LVRINENYAKLQGAYLFSEIARRRMQFAKDNPSAQIISMGIGDVTQPLSSKVIEAMQEAVLEMADTKTFKGYGPEQGYDFLREAIAKNDYHSRGVQIDSDEVFISDGSKCDTGNFQEILHIDNVVAITDPVYPVYVDTNVMAGRTDEFDTLAGRYKGIHYLDCTGLSGFKPELPREKVDVIYLCSPNNPTGVAFTYEELKVWVDYAKANKSLILFDAAYEAYIRESDIPHSIYEIEGAKEVAVEFRSFSKTAGFTGTRCAFAVVPKQLKAFDSKGGSYSLNALWNRRHTTKFNGVSYVIQRGAAAVYTEEGRAQVKETINYYMENATLIRANLESLGFKVYGGVNAPYIWMKCSNNMGSWDFFNKLLSEAHVVTTPGVGFGNNGEGYIRLTAFGSRENTEKAMERIGKIVF
jgi:LL-diaminopimelate aminotransferase